MTCSFLPYNRRGHPWYSGGQQVEWLILGQGHDSRQNSSHSPRLSRAQYSLNSTESWPKTPIISIFQRKGLPWIISNLYFMTSCCEKYQNKFMELLNTFSILTWFLKLRINRNKLWSLKYYTYEKINMCRFSHTHKYKMIPETYSMSDCWILPGFCLLIL